jgi:hypothetical protein
MEKRKTLQALKATPHLNEGKEVNLGTVKLLHQRKEDKPVVFCSRHILAHITHHHITTSRTCGPL